MGQNCSSKSTSPKQCYVYSVIIVAAFTWLMILVYRQDISLFRLSTVQCVSQRYECQKGCRFNALHGAIKMRFSERSAHLQKACLNVKHLYDVGVKKSPCEEYTLKSHLRYSNKSNLLYCQIEKAGSTFWQKVMHVLETDVSDLYSLRSEQAYGKSNSILNLPFDKAFQVLKSAKKILFVREPFSRLLSAYLDKLFNPNIIHWKLLGKWIVERERFSGNNSINVSCGFDVSFKEFVSYYINWTGTHNCIEPHYSEGYRHCHPCEIDFDYIGKVETFNEDAAYIFQELNLTEVIDIMNINTSSEIDAIIDAVDWLYVQKQEIMKCTSFKYAMSKVWQRLKARGFLLKYSQFPFIHNETVNIKKTEFKEIVLRTYNESFRSAERRQNRIEVLREAYGTLSKWQVRQLQRIFRVDFELFNYSSSPYFLETDSGSTNKYKFLSF